MTLRYIFAAIELLLLAVFLMAFPVLNLGNLAGIAVSLGLFIITVKPKPVSALLVRAWKHPGGKAAVIMLCAVMAAAACFGVWCSVRMYLAMSRENGKPSAVVVLGCQVKGERPSRMLRHRLDAAAEYLRQEPQLPCIVSGGKGWDEKISEALCMKNYLVEQGIDESRIIMEDKSTSTDENLEYSFEILDSMGLSRDIVLITDGYHQYRAQLIAGKHGAGDISSVSAETELRYLPTYWVREWFGIFQQLVLK